MSFYEELLTLGQWLQPADKIALYRFFIKTQKDRYIQDSRILQFHGELKTFIANGEITYVVKGDYVSYTAKKKNSTETYENLRKIKLGTISTISSKRLQKFFAQSEVDVLANFPLPGVNPQEEGGFGFFARPFYDLNYYSNGRGKIIGLFKKFQAKDDELLEKLLAS
jgi:hypothetical protein